MCSVIPFVRHSGKGKTLGIGPDEWGQGYGDDENVLDRDWREEQRQNRTRVLQEQPHGVTVHLEKMKLYFT